MYLLLKTIKISVNLWFCVSSEKICLFKQTMHICIKGLNSGFVSCEHKRGLG